jgi:hypothetical protein
MLTVGGIVGGGFRLLRERPLAVLVWSLIYAAMIVGTMMVVRPFMQLAGATAAADPQAVLANIGTMMGRIFLMELLMLVVFTILMTAAQRAVLRPAEASFAFMRVGMDELRMFALAIILLLASYFGMVILGVVIAIVASLLAAAAGMAAVGAAMVVAMILLVAVFVWLEIRFCLAFPLTLLRRKIIIGESWRLTKGRFWTLFGGFLLLFLALLALWIVVALLTQGGYWSELIRNGMNPQAAQAAAAQQMAAQLAFSPMMIVGLAVGGLVGGVTVAVFGGAVATAVRLLVDDTDRYAETFT